MPEQYIDLFDKILANFNYIASFGLFCLGLFILITSQNLVKKVIGLAIFQSSFLIFLISVGYIAGGSSPIITGKEEEFFVNPLPQVLVLTAIVVGIATVSVALALIIRIKKAFGTVNEVELQQ